MTLRDVTPSVSVTPLVFTPPVGQQRVGIGGRLLALILSVVAVGVLVTALLITPSPEGVGTHRQIRALTVNGAAPPACEMLRRTGLPCPTCGMTTSFAWFVRGNWLASLYVQPMGFILALTTAGLFWAGLFIALTGAPLHRLLTQLRGVVWITALMGFAIAAWGWKIFIHLGHLDGWR
jgi:hypothetical protein